MTSNPRPWPTSRSVAFAALALVAILAAAVGTGLFTPQNADAQRSARTAGRGFLGVSLQDLDDDLRDSYDYKGSGVLVSEVSDGSPAEEVGIREGDILVKVDDRTVSSSEQLTDLVRGMAPGTLVGITVVRDGDTRFLGRAEIADLGNRRGDERIAPRAPRTPRTPRAPRAVPAPMPRVAPLPDSRVFSFDSRGRLGVETHDLDRDLGTYFHATGGVLVLKVVDDTPAAKAGLKAGDVILGVGGKDVDDTDALRRALRDRDAGDVELRVMRNGSERSITARLDERQSFDWNGMPGGGDWMSLFNDDRDNDRDGDDGEDADPDQDGRQIRRHVFRLPGNGDSWHEHDGLGNLGDLEDMKNDMTPEQRERLEKEMDKLRDDMKNLRKELREMRSNRR